MSFLNKLFGPTDAQKEQIEQYISHSVEDGVVSSEERQSILDMAKEYNIPLSDIDAMILTAFRDHFQKMIKTFAADGEFTEKEMASLRTRAVRLGIDEATIQQMLEEALMEHKEEVKAKVKAAFIKAGKIAAAAVAFTGAALLLLGSTSSTPAEVYQRGTVNTTCKCAKCGRRITKGTTAFGYKGMVYCCIDCVTSVINNK